MTAQVGREPARDAPTESSSGPPPIAADSQWIDVTVVDAVTAQPAANVDVWWRNQQQEERIRAVTEAEWRRLSYADQLLTEIGWHARTDELGQVRITALPRGYVFVMARDATRYAQSDFTLAAAPPPGGHRLLLQRDRTLRVHVTDAAGGDAGGVPIRLLQTDDRGRENEVYGRSWLRTDERGCWCCPTPSSGAAGTTCRTTASPSMRWSWPWQLRASSRCRQGSIRTRSPTSRSSCDYRRPVT
ncbi:MAG: hypothetical protein R3F29_14060 [Planctomycetota bacterium]